jgi:hypothetical protein
LDAVSVFMTGPAQISFIPGLKNEQSPQRLAIVFFFRKSFVDQPFNIGTTKRSYRPMGSSFKWSSTNSFSCIE